MSHLKQFLSILTITGVLFGCSSANVKNPEYVTAIDDPRHVAKIDCMLPSRIRKLGQNSVYVSPGRQIKTSTPDCKIRGGQII